MIWGIMDIKEVVVCFQDLQNSSDHAKAKYMRYVLLFIQNVSGFYDKLKGAYLTCGKLGI